MDRAENTASSISSVAARVPFAAIAQQQAYLQSHSLATAVSSGFTILAFSRHATLFPP
jgi:hypothetical protein